MSMQKTRCLGRVRFVMVWLGLLALIVSSTAVPRVFAAADEVPTLFYNDTAWAMDDYYPSLGYVSGQTEDFWIPLSFYEEIDNMRVKRGSAKNHTIFVIQNTATEKYLSFNINDSSFAQTERGTLILIHTMLFSKERYLPMREMCAYFGWTFEISPDRKSVRICDGKQQRRFSDLLADYARPDETDTPVTQPVQTEPVVTTPADDPDIYRAAAVYLTFEDMDASYTPQILDTLKAHAVRATFFVSGEQMSRDPDLVVRMLAEGHSVGLHGMTDDELQLRSTEDILGAFDTENDLLYALVRRKTRLVRLPNGSRSGKLVLTDVQKQALAEAGYLLWDWNISAMDHDTAYTADMVLEKIDAAMKTSYYPVIRMHCTETAAEVLDALLARFAETETKVCAISDADTPVVFP